MWSSFVAPDDTSQVVAADPQQLQRPAVHRDGVHHEWQHLFLWPQLKKATLATEALKPD